MLLAATGLGDAFERGILSALLGVRLFLAGVLEGPSSKSFAILEGQRHTLSLATRQGRINKHYHHDE
jgi:hypothetical protein